MNRLAGACMVPNIELDCPNSAVHLGKVYFFCTTEERDKFEASQQHGGDKVFVSRSGKDHERRFGPSDKTAGRLGPLPVSSRSPIASFLG